APAQSFCAPIHTPHEQAARSQPRRATPPSSDRERVPHAEQRAPRRSALRCTTDARARRTLQNSGTGWPSQQASSTEVSPILHSVHREVQWLSRSSRDTSHHSGFSSHAQRIFGHLAPTLCRDEHGSVPVSAEHYAITEAILAANPAFAS